MSTIHCTFRGTQHTFDFEEIFAPDRYTAIGIADGIDVRPDTVSNEQVKMALAQKFDVGVGEFNDDFVEINPNGNITLRPNTVFG